MKEECSKYGTVNHAHVDKNSKVALFLCKLLQGPCQCLCVASLSTLLMVCTMDGLL